MGCRQSQVYDPEDTGVEALRYSRRRPTKLKRSKRKKSSKKNGCHQVTFSPVVEEVNPGNSEGSPDFTSADSGGKFGKKRNKDINEHVQMFGNKGVRGVLTMAVDTSEVAAMEAKQGRFGTKHVFPVWEVHYNETCKCVNTDSDELSDEDEWRKSSTRLCSRCSHVIVNSKRRIANNNNSSSSSVAVETSSTVTGNDSSSAGGKCENELSLQESAKEYHLAAIANLLALVGVRLYGLSYLKRWPKLALLTSAATKCNRLYPACFLYVDIPSNCCLCFQHKICISRLCFIAYTILCVLAGRNEVHPPCISALCTKDAVHSQCIYVLYGWSDCID